MESNPYINDILGQPAVLADALDQYDPRALAPLARALAAGTFDRILLTGMGASYYGAYPASLILSGSGLPVLWVDTAELLHYSPAAISARTLLCIISQSGRSAEALSLLELIRETPPGAVLAVVNDLSSPLAQAATYALPICAEPELTVSTRTFMNTLALSQLAALQLVGEDLAPGLAQLRAAVAAIAAYLEPWPAPLEHTGHLVGRPEHLFLLGRGPSLAAAFGGALVAQEAAKYPASALQSAEFRHGPLELCDPTLSALIFGGPPVTRALNLRLFEDLRARDAHALWLDPEDGATPEAPVVPEGLRLPMPAARGIGLPLAEIVPAQVLSVYLARLTGVEAGAFRHIGKVTLTE